MNSVLFNAFYDSVQYNVGNILVYVFLFLMVIELIYVMAKYLSGGDK